MIRNPPIGRVELVSGYLDYLLSLESPLDLTMTLLFLTPLIYQHHTLYFLICLETSSFSFNSKEFSKKVTHLMFTYINLHKEIGVRKLLPPEVFHSHEMQPTFLLSGDSHATHLWESHVTSYRAGINCTWL